MMELSKLPYVTRMAILAKRCEVPTKSGEPCTADKLPGVQFCVSHKRSLGARVNRLITGALIGGSAW